MQLLFVSIPAWYIIIAWIVLVLFIILCLSINASYRNAETYRIQWETQRAFCSQLSRQLDEMTQKERGNLENEKHLMIENDLLRRSLKQQIDQTNEIFSWIKQDGELEQRWNEFYKERRGYRADQGSIESL